MSSSVFLIQVAQDGVHVEEVYVSRRVLYRELAQCFARQLCVPFGTCAPGTHEVDGDQASVFPQISETSERLNVRALLTSRLDIVLLTVSSGC